MFSLDRYQFILVCSKTNLHRMGNAGFPLRIGMGHEKVVMALLIAMLVEILLQHTSLHRRHLITEISAGLI